MVAGLPAKKGLWVRPQASLESGHYSGFPYIRYDFFPAICIENIVVESGSYGFFKEDGRDFLHLSCMAAK